MTTINNAVKSVLTARARNVIAGAYSNALKSAENNGTLVTTVVTVAREHMKGKPFLPDDLESIVSTVAREQGWKGRTIKSRCTEVRSVLKAYASLPEAIKFAQSTGTCGFHFVIAVARQINKGLKPDAAVKAARKRKSAGDKVSIKGRIASLLKRMWKEDRKNRAAAVLAWDALHIAGDIAK